MILLAVLRVVAVFVGGSKLTVALNFAVLTFGVSLGWIFGIVVSPYSAEKQRQFTALSKAVAVFASGYAVGKLDSLIGKLVDPAFALESVHGFRLLAFILAFAILMVFTFVYRQYARV